MKIKASKVMAKALMQGNTDGTYIDNIECIDLEERMYGLSVDYDIYAHENDYQPESRRFKALRITYKDECCAPIQYITTNDLVKEYRNSDKTYDGFINQVLTAYSI